MTANKFATFGKGPTLKPINEPCYLILTQGSYTVPGDERSRTNPGHGYPEHTETYTNVEVIPTLEELQSRVEYMNANRYSPSFQIGQFIPMKVETKVILK